MGGRILSGLPVRLQRCVRPCNNIRSSQEERPKYTSVWFPTFKWTDAWQFPSCLNYWSLSSIASWHIFTRVTSFWQLRTQVFVKWCRCPKYWWRSKYCSLKILIIFIIPGYEFLCFILYALSLHIQFKIHHK